MTLNEKLAALGELGLPLAPGITAEDVEYTCGSDPDFGELLFVLGVEVEREPWGRPFCQRAWNLDTECIEGPGSYAGIVSRLVSMSESAAVTSITDHVDLEKGQAWLEYDLGERRVHLDADVDDDWADMVPIVMVASDIEYSNDTHRFWGMDNGQAIVLFWLTSEQVTGIDQLVGSSLLRTFTPE